MKSYKKTFLFGLIVWVVPFIAAMAIFQLRENERILFESIMPVVLSLAAIIMANLYFKVVEINFIKEGVFLGIYWLVISIVIDQLMFSWGPMKMTVLDYIKDIGVTYLMIPVITIGTGWAEEVRFKKFMKLIPPAH
jgi:hypothetical protein